MLKQIIRQAISYYEFKHINGVLEGKKKRSVDLSGAKRFLCLQMNAIGDAIMTQPAWAAIRRYFPDATVDLVCSPLVAPLFEKDPAIRWIHSFDKRRYIPWLFDDYKHVRRTLTELNYDVLVDFSALPLTAALCAGGDMPPSIGFQRIMKTSAGAIDLGMAYDTTYPYSENIHLRTLMSNLVTTFVNIENDLFSPKIHLDEASVGDASALIAGHGLKEKPFILVHPGVKWAPKSWPIQNWQKLIVILCREMSLPVFILGSMTDKERIEKILLDGRLRDIPHYISNDIRLSAALIQSAMLCLCHDSAPMHMAAALGVKAISLFGPVSPSRSAPQENDGARALYHDMFCSPCTLYYSRDRCRRGINFCMHALKPDEVARIVGEILYSQQ